MTTNNTVLSTQSTGAIQARANSQSAVIALMGAGSAAAGGSFADSLDAEAKRQTSPQGLFSESKEASSPRESKKPDRARKPREDDDTQPVEPRTEGTRTEPDAAGAPAPEDRFTLVPTSEPPAPSRAQVTNDAPAQPGEVTAAAQQTQPETRTEPTNERGAARADESAVRGPTDPLRLIVQRSESSEDAPAQPGAVQGNAADAKDETATKNATHSGSHQQPQHGNSGNGSTAGNSGFGLAGAVATGRAVNAGAETGQDSAAVTSVGGAAGTGGGTRVGAPLDQVAPPRTGPNRPLEQPVTLKLKLSGPASAPQNSLSQEEVSAAEAQIARGLTAAFRQNTPQVTMWMSPETLGKVRIQLTFDQGTISARFEATSEATKDLLASNMDSLRSALQSRGLTADHIEVVSIPDWSAQGSAAGSDNRVVSGGSTSTSGEASQGNSQHSNQGKQEHSGTWNTMLSNFGTQVDSAKNDSSAEPIPSINVSKTLLKLQARLELDAVA